MKKSLNRITQIYRKIRMKNHLKRLYDSLCYYSKYPKKDVSENKEKNESLFRAGVPEKIEKLLYEYKYISDDEEKCLDPLYMITPTGNEFLMKLDNIYYKDWKFWIALVALIVTLGRQFNLW